MCCFLLSQGGFCAGAAVFGVVRCGLKSAPTDQAALGGVIPKNLRFERLPFFILQQYMPEELAIDRIGDALNTDMLFPVIQIDAVAVIIVEQALRISLLALCR